MAQNLLLSTTTTLLLLSTPILTLPTAADNAPADAPPSAVDSFTGHGTIHVLNSSSPATASIADSIGCLNERGLLVSASQGGGGGGCAVFARADAAPHTLSTRAGDCSFRNPDMPTNEDSVYGRDGHAWSCVPAADVGFETYYTVDGFRYPFVCNGNLNCYYDVVDQPVPEDGQGALPVWQFFWGSEQMGPPEGHLQVLWLWVPAEL
ncbi:hypothetical protein VTK26DRAFT_9140 [Humicola hyalothermophila]